MHASKDSMWREIFENFDKMKWTKLAPNLNGTTFSATAPGLELKLAMGGRPQEYGAARGGRRRRRCLACGNSLLYWYTGYVTSLDDSGCVVHGFWVKASYQVRFQSIFCVYSRSCLRTIQTLTSLLYLYQDTRGNQHQKSVSAFFD